VSWKKIGKQRHSMLVCGVDAGVPSIATPVGAMSLARNE
jgi:hypothetical protein